jgi:hypothetical protein
MSRLRTDFYNHLPVEGDAAKADKDCLTLDCVANAYIRSSNDFSGLAEPPFGIWVAESCHDGLLPAAGIVSLTAHIPFPNSAGHPLYHPRNCDTGEVCLQEE